MIGQFSRLIARNQSALITSLCVILITMSMIIIFSWWLKISFFVKTNPHVYTVFSFNSALCFLLSAIILLTSNFSQKLTNKTQFALSLILIIFASLNFIDIILNFKLGVNQIINTTWIASSNLAPIGMTLTMAIVFMTTGFSLLVLSFPLEKKAYFFVQSLVFLIFSLGALSLIGHLLRLDFLFEWYKYTRMAVLPAIGAIILSLSLWLLIAKKRPANLHKNSEVKLINLGSIAILIIVALSAAIAGFTLLISQYQNFIIKFLETSIHNRSVLLQKDINNPFKEIDAILNNPIFQNAITQKEQIDNIGKMFITQGFSAIQIKDRDNHIIFSRGSFIQPLHKIKIKSKTPAELIWKKNVFITLHKPIFQKGNLIATIHAQWSLAILDQWFQDKGKGLNPADLFLCAHSSNPQEVQCLSANNYPKLETFSSKHNLFIPINYALTGHSSNTSFLNEKNNFFLSIYGPIGNYGLSLIYTKSMLEVFKPSHAQLLNVFIIILIIIGIGAILLYWQVTPLIRKIVNSEKKASLREKQLQTSENYLRGIMENIGEGLITINEEGCIESFNTKAVSIFGYQTHEVLNKNLTMLMPPHYRAKHLTGMSRYLSTGEAHVVNRTSVEVEGLHKNGTIIPLELTINEIIIKGRRTFAGIIRDITQRKKIEEDQALLTSIITSSNDAIIGVYLDNTIFCWNQAAENLYGYKKEEIIGKSVDLITPEHKKEELIFITEHITKGEFVYLETERSHKDGHILAVAIAISPIKNPEGELIGKSAISHDISEKRQLEKIKNEFISVVSHELRTPLTSIHGSISLLVGGVVSQMPPKAMKLLEIAKQNTELLIRLINDILDIEKIEAGRMELRLEPIELSNLIEEAVMNNQAYAEKFSVAIEIIQPVPTIKVYVDRDRLLQVLNNLISNGIKFSPTDNKISISALTLPDNKIRVSVSDNGQGIPQAFQASIFQKFAQADSTMTRKQQGTGLGLSISKAIIEKFNGTIGFNTQENSGTTFFFDLPIYKETYEKVTFKKTTTLLLCEDDQDFSALFKEILEQHEFKVLTAYTVQEAKQKLQEHKIDVLLLDLILPDQDGISFIKELRQEEKTAYLPIIVISVKAKEGKDELNGNAFTVLDWIEKPVDFERFLHTVNLLEKHIHKKTPRILHIEDDVSLSQVVANVIQKEAEITTVKTLSTAKEELKKNKYDLVILDLLLPDGSGMELFPLLSKKHIPIIIFSAYELPKEYAHYVQSSLLKTKTSIDFLLNAVNSAINERNKWNTYGKLNFK